MPESSCGRFPSTQTSENTRHPPRQDVYRNPSSETT